jgi:hypothetical protein
MMGPSATLAADPTRRAGASSTARVTGSQGNLPLRDLRWRRDNCPRIRCRRRHAPRRPHGRRLTSGKGQFPDVTGPRSTVTALKLATGRAGECRIDLGGQRPGRRSLSTLRRTRAAREPIVGACATRHELGTSTSLAVCHGSGGAGVITGASDPGRDTRAVLGFAQLRGEVMSRAASSSVSIAPACRSRSSGGRTGGASLQ